MRDDRERLADILEAIEKIEKYAARGRQACLTTGNPDQAQKLALSRDTKEFCDPAWHLAWADVLEEMGLIDEVVKELNLALRDDPDNREIYARLARFTSTWVDLTGRRTSGGPGRSTFPGMPRPTASGANFSGNRGGPRAGTPGFPTRS